MDTARWQKVQWLFHQAADLTPDEQQSFLESNCGEDAELKADVSAMLSGDRKSAPLLERDLVEIASQVMASDTSSKLPRHFGPYRVMRVLGEGGMGVVYLGQREDLGNLVAIKVLRDAWLSPARRERFASEQRMLAQLNHPSIARLYDADALADGTPWFVMEYVEGVPLTEYCRMHGSSIAERVGLFRAVCQAVQYAHGQAVIHRDLKPSNILVKDDGSIRLLDFGIAKQVEGLDASVDQTMTGFRLMTPAYAAPEQIRGERVGIHTDVYSLGVILFEILGGRLPFDLANLTPAEAATIITDHEPGKPSMIGRTSGIAGAETLSKLAWSDLDVLCLTAMHKDPERRYRSVEAVIRDVDHYLKGEPLDARPDSLHYKLGKFVRRNERAVLVSAAVVLLVLGMAAFFAVRLAKARNAALAEAARTQRIQKFMMNLFEGGDEAAGPSDSLKVVSLLDRGVMEAKTLNNDRREQSELYQNLGSIYQNLGKLDQADWLLHSALDERRAAFGTESAEAAETLVAYGLLRDAQGKFDEAERFVREGLEIDRKRLSPNHPAIARATSALGKVLEDRGAYADAIRVLEQAVRLESADETDKTELAESLTELANSHFYSGHYKESEVLNERVLAMDRKLYGDRHPHVADDLINLGAIQYDLGNYGEADRYDRQALDITQGFYGKNHPATASALTILGRTLVSEGKSNEASGMLKEALAVEEQVYGKVHPRVAGTLNELGKIAQQQGKLEEAEADFTRMTEIYREVYAGQHYYIGIALSNLAGVYVERKEYGEAEKLYGEALQIYAKTLPAEHLNVGIARVRLGRVLVLEHKFVEAESESRAGYEILMKQPSAPGKFMVMARTDLAQEYEALQRPEESKKFRAELASAEQKNSPMASSKP